MTNQSEGPAVEKAIECEANYSDLLRRALDGERFAIRPGEFTDQLQRVSRLLAVEAELGRAWELARLVVRYVPDEPGRCFSQMRSLAVSLLPAPPSPPVAPEAQEAGGVERVSHAQAREMIDGLHRVAAPAAAREPWVTDTVQELVRYLVQQEQSEREATTLQEAIDSHCGLSCSHIQKRYQEHRDEALALRSALTEAQSLLVLSESQREEAQAKLAHADLWRKACDATAEDRDAYKRQLQAQAEELEALLELERRVRGWEKREVSQASLLTLQKLDAIRAKPAQQADAAAPVAKAEAPSEPAGWVPKVGDPVRVTAGDLAGQLGTVVDHEAGRTWPYGVVFAGGYIRRFVAESLEPAPRSPATAGGAAGGPKPLSYEEALDAMGDEIERHPIGGHGRKKPAQAEQKDPDPRLWFVVEGADGSYSTCQSEDEAKGLLRCASEGSAITRTRPNPAGERGDFRVCLDCSKYQDSSLPCLPGCDRYAYPAQPQPQGDGVTRAELVAALRSERVLKAKQFSLHELADVLERTKP